MEDILIQVDKFYYPFDFVVLDTEPMQSGINPVPIILGRPFLATTNALINCRNGLMQLSFGNMTLELNIFHLCKQLGSSDYDEQEVVCLIGQVVEENWSDLHTWKAEENLLVDQSEGKNIVENIPKLAKTIWEPKTVLKMLTNTSTENQKSD